MLADSRRSGDEIHPWLLNGDLSYGQIWCMPMKSSGDLVLFFDLFSINEFHTCNDLCQVCEAA